MASGWAVLVVKEYSLWPSAQSFGGWVVDPEFSCKVTSALVGTIEASCDDANVTLGDVFPPTSLFAMICLIRDSEFKGASGGDLGKLCLVVEW